MWMLLLDTETFKGKIIFCDGVSNGTAALMSGAIGLVTHHRKIESSDAHYFYLPASFLSEEDANDVIKYLRSTSNPTATIMTSTLRYGSDTLAPRVAHYSSRGPNKITSDILKPDLSAPGDTIIAAYSEAAAIREGDDRVTKFKALSGTSMACPHATSAAAYIKSFYPSWSPAALKSALMTTAVQMTSDFIDAEFGYGSGNIHPLAALDPGLVYDASTKDYIDFLCGQNYDADMLELITGEYIVCYDAKTVWDLNYPSFALSTKSLKHVNGTFSRNVTNVGPPNSIYAAHVTAPDGLEIYVNPSVLSFTAIGETRVFTVTVQGRINRKVASASLTWNDGVRKVRSPIIVFHESLHRNEAAKAGVIKSIFMIVICCLLNVLLVLV